MKIKQFEDKELAHYSYAIVHKGKMALIDPARNPAPYYAFAEQEQARIVAVIETHPHADFVSSHLEIHKTTGANIYISGLAGVTYPHTPFDENDVIMLEEVRLKALNTPGHSPDSICIVAIDEEGTEKAVFTGDTLFIGDCGRPDLREAAGAITAARTELAQNMYGSLHNKLMHLPNEVLVYPAHGAGSLCGKGLSEQNTSTIGTEKITNWSLQNISEEDFVAELLNEQPHIPQYFPYAVSLNMEGAEQFITGTSRVKRGTPVNDASSAAQLDPQMLIIDSRPHEEFKKAHLKHAINLMVGGKFETWLGSIVKPGEKFYLIGENEAVLDKLIERIAKIGYESQIAMAFVANYGDEQTDLFDGEAMRNNEDAFTIIDIRNESEVKKQKIFSKAIYIPLHQLRERINEIPMNKPIVVHCAGGYRSAAGSSIIESAANNQVPVYDLSEAVTSF
jgi:hydroxyacylglutathione hydrolase